MIAQTSFFVKFVYFFVTQQYKNVQNLITFAQDENTKIAYQNALSAIDREFQLTQDFIKKTQEEIPLKKPS